MANPKSTNPTATHFSGIPLKALIGAPLKAATDANGMMARAQTQFLLSTCFEKSPEDDNVLTPIMIQFHLQRKALNTDGTSQTNDSSMLFNIPLMTVIPISSLAVESLNISFEMDVKNSTEYNQENSNDQKMSTTGRFSDYKGAQFTTEMYGALSSSNKKTGESKSSARYEIELKAGQLPLPRGLTAILDIFTQNLAPLPAKSSGADNTPDNTADKAINNAIDRDKQPDTTP